MGNLSYKSIPPFIILLGEFDWEYEFENDGDDTDFHSEIMEMEWIVACRGVIFLRIFRSKFTKVVCEKLPDVQQNKYSFS